MESFFARNRLSAYLDRTLPKGEAEAIAEAIARDIALSADVQAMQKTLSLMHTCGRAPAPTGFSARTMASIATQPVPGSQVAWLQRRMARMPTELLALAGAMAVILVAINRANDGADERLASNETTMEDPAVAPQDNAKTVEQTSDTAAVEPPENASTPAVKAVAKPAKSNGSKARTPVPKSLPYDPASPLSYRILHGGDQVLYDIAVLADETGGRLVDVHGKLFTPHSLNESRSFSQLYLITNIDESAKAHAMLIERSGMEPYPINGPQPPLGEDETVFLIEAQL
jgi:hypothetical protein